MHLGVQVQSKQLLFTKQRKTETGEHVNSFHIKPHAALANLKMKQEPLTLLRKMPQKQKRSTRTCRKRCEAWKAFRNINNTSMRKLEEHPLPETRWNHTNAPWLLEISCIPRPCKHYHITIWAGQEKQMTQPHVGQVCQHRVMYGMLNTVQAPEPTLRAASSGQCWLGIAS